jgi:thiamine-monophosphate kinase
MGAIPRWALLSLAIPANFPFDELEAFLDGFAEQAASHSVLLVGGDTCGSRSGLVISVTIMGEQYPELMLKRSGAQPGDDIWVSGTVGDSALGLQLLQGNATEYASDALRYVVNRHLDPAPRCRLGQCLATARLVTSMVDISDGLLADLGHICRQSGCGADIDLASAPLSQSFREATASEAYFPWRLAVCGGEDYELCFTAPSCNRAAIQEISKTAGVQVAVIGKVTDSGRVVARLPDGSDFQPSASGYTHF